MNDKEILEIINKERECGFHLLLEKYQNLVLNIAFSYFGSQAEAEDVSQEVFLKVFQKIDSFQKNSKISTWLYRITMNTCHDESRKKKKRNQGYILDEENLSYEDQKPEIRELKKVVNNSIRNLAPKYREVVLLKDYAELSYKEIK